MHFYFESKNIASERYERHLLQYHNIWKWTCITFTLNKTMKIILLVRLLSLLQILLFYNYSVFVRLVVTWAVYMAIDRDHTLVMALTPITATTTFWRAKRQYDDRHNNDKNCTSASQRGASLSTKFKNSFSREQHTLIEKDCC